MSGIFGHLNLSDTDRVFNNTAGQRTIFQAATDYVNASTEVLNRLLGVFVARSTSDHTLRFKLPGNGNLQRRGPDGRFGSVKAIGSWDVAFPLEDFGAMITGNDVDMAYMTVEELDRHIRTVVQQNVNTVRFEVLTALMSRSNGTFIDPLHGSLTIRSLANTDGTVYPPVIGSVTEADDEHYLELGDTAAAIDDTHDPWTGVNTNSVAIVAELEEHFGVSAGSSEIVSFINQAEVTEVSGLTDFEPVDILQINEGAQTASPVQVPTNLPGTVIGRHRGGAWIVRWDFVPATYILSVHTGVEPPLYKRIDPADTGLGTDLRLVATDEEFPFKESVWRHRLGYAVANRLNGVCVEAAAGGSYTDPTIV
ncbi:MAG: hypothetical protein KAJ73_01035 [Zetaproteobacteria bacterium]|nr:hypothetical protein [Zetaproteobacteria bacterium]